ncbi:MAG: calcium-binding protein [Cyanobacteria bacterium P01_D01_bin.6]
MKPGAIVKVLRIAPESDCEREMFVAIAGDDNVLAVPLMQLAAQDMDEDTRQAIADWYYWVNQGYEFG